MQPRSLISKGHIYEREPLKNKENEFLHPVQAPKAELLKSASDSILLKLYHILNDLKWESVNLICAIVPISSPLPAFWF